MMKTKTTSKRKTVAKHITTCGWCKYFIPHKSKSGYANGYWLGDGKCKYQKVTVQGDTCFHYKQSGVEK